MKTLSTGAEKLKRIDKVLAPGAKVKKIGYSQDIGEVISHDHRDLFALVKWSENYSNWIEVYSIEESE